jgi:hypothetical protein
MTRKLRRRSSNVRRIDLAHAGGIPQPTGPFADAGSPTAAASIGAVTVTNPLDVPNTDKAAKTKSRAAREDSVPPPQFNINGEASQPGIKARNRRHSSRGYHQKARPVVLSLAVHAVGLVLFTTLGFTTLVQHAPRLFASPAEFSAEPPEEFSEVKIESSKLNDTELQTVRSESDDFNLADNSRHEFEPSQLGMGSQALGDVGQLDSLPSELGTLMAGAGSPGSGPPGGELGEAVFFGTRSQGNRIVFVVDNSSSMKDGRFEAAIGELVRSVEALSPRQAFYVIFVSDQPYPMFYPQPATDLMPATAPNKKRLAEWLPKAILASGKNRELMKAMDLAASLRPHAVYLLWDGDMRYSDRVRTEVMTHLTRPNQWNFPIHTLGMGITSLDAEQNLTAIALAHGGTYRRIDVPPNRGR